MHGPMHAPPDDELAELEAGTLAPPATTAADVSTPSPAEVARLWGAALNLRPGNSRGPYPKALAPVVARWAEERGWPGPDNLSVGRGLTKLGLRRRLTGGSYKERGRRYLLLHKEDAALLWRQAREVWAPLPVPGDAASRPKYRYPRPPSSRPARSTYTPMPWAQALASVPKAKPLVDSLGRVWPSPATAVLALGGSTRSIQDVTETIQRVLLGPKVDTSGLTSAITRQLRWRGLLWRRLTPEEVGAIPHNHMVGVPLRALRWGLVCHHCGSPAKF